MDRTTSLSFDYGVTCGQGGVPHFEFTVDGHPASSDKIITTACGVSGQTVSLVLSPGPHTLRWIFSVEPGEGQQEAAPLQSSAGVPVATISSVRVEDSISGAASSCNPCPAGTYAPSPTSRCAPCPKGTTSSPAGGGGTSCVPCPADTFSPVAGSPKCRPCGPQTGTGGRMGAAACSANFTFEDAGGSSSVDLSFIKGVYGPVVVYDAFGMGKTGALYFSGEREIAASLNRRLSTPKSSPMNPALSASITNPQLSTPRKCGFSAKSSTLNPQPSTLETSGFCAKPQRLNPQPSTLNPTPVVSVLNPSA